MAICQILVACALSVALATATSSACSAGQHCNAVAGSALVQHKLLAEHRQLPEDDDQQDDDDQPEEDAQPGNDDQPLFQEDDDQQDDDDQPEGDDQPGSDNKPLFQEAGLSNEEHEKLVLTFHTMDVDSSNDLTLEELNHGALDTEVLRIKFMEDNDADNSGTISYDEFRGAYETFRDDEHDGAMPESTDVTLLQAYVMGERVEQNRTGKGGRSSRGRRRRGSSRRRRSCPGDCHYSPCTWGDKRNGGQDMTWKKACTWLYFGCSEGWRCTHRCSQKYGNQRYCGKGNNYMPGSIDCKACR